MRQLVVYADDVNLLVDNKNTLKINAEALIDAYKEVGAEANTQFAEYMLIRDRIIT
jgi:hypothetical protein